jgi:thiol-disulfide isomerase/thioredoxin
MKIINYEQLKQYSNNKYIICISAQWCKPCQILKPKIYNIINKINNCIYLELDYQDYENDSEFHFLDCTKLPHFTFYKDDKIDEKIETSNEEIIKNKINSFYGLLDDDF